MTTYRVTVNVTTDIESEDENQAMFDALTKLRKLVGDNPHAQTGSAERDCWVTGIMSDQERGHYVFPLDNSNTKQTVAYTND